MLSVLQFIPARHRHTARLTFPCYSDEAQNMYCRKWSTLRVKESKPTWKNMPAGSALGCVCISVWKHKGLIYPQEYVGGKEAAEKHPQLYENPRISTLATGSLPLCLHLLDTWPNLHTLISKLGRLQVYTENQKTGPARGWRWVKWWRAWWARGWDWILIQTAGMASEA